MPGSDQTALVLASSSRHRQSLLQRLGVDFTCDSPDIDETALAGESPAALCHRLAERKARSVAERYERAVIIGSDQVVDCNGRVFGKPGHHDAAVEQLLQASGREVLFLTSVCVLRLADGLCLTETVPSRVLFRELDRDTVSRYLQREQPYDCAGAFRSEGLGIALLQRIDSEDPTALIGLPLIRLCRMLGEAGIRVI